MRCDCAFDDPCKNLLVRVNLFLVYKSGSDMRASDQEQIGGAGASEVSAKFQLIGWGQFPIKSMI